MLVAVDAQDTSITGSPFRLLEKRPPMSSELQAEGGEVKVSHISNNVDVEVRNVSQQSIEIIGGRLKQFASQWQCITSDPFILNSVNHYKIEFENGEPQQCMPPKEINFTQQEQEVIDMEIDKLLIKGVISETTHCPGEHISLEMDKTTALRQNKGNYNTHMKLSQESAPEIKWWYDNITTVKYPILLATSKVDVIIYTDASTNGLGAVKDAEKTGGRWSEEEAKYHINCLELIAAFFGLKAFCKNEQGIHVQIYSDNPTTANYINAMGGTHSRECNTIAKNSWQWCRDQQMCLTAAHIPGTKNVEANRESRVFSDNKEWMMRPDIFQKITDIWGEHDYERQSKPSCCTKTTR